MTTHKWRDRPGPDDLHAHVKDAINPGSANKRPAVELPRGQKILNSTGADPQARAWGPKGSLINHGGFGGARDNSEHSLVHGGDSAAPSDQGTAGGPADFVPPVGGGRK
jgi:hypothetical protein